MNHDRNVECKGESNFVALPRLNKHTKPDHAGLSMGESMGTLQITFKLNQLI